MVRAYPPLDDMACKGTGTVVLVDHQARRVLPQRGFLPDFADQQVDTPVTAQIGKLQRMWTQQILIDAMFDPGLAQADRSVGARLEPAQFTAQGIAVDGCIPFLNDDLWLAVAVYIANRDQGGDVVVRVRMEFPYDVNLLAPGAAEDHLVPAVLIEIGDLKQGIHRAVRTVVVQNSPMTLRTKRGSGIEVAPSAI